MTAWALIVVSVFFATLAFSSYGVWSRLDPSANPLSAELVIEAIGWFTGALAFIAALHLLFGINP